MKTEDMLDRAFCNNTKILFLLIHLTSQECFRASTFFLARNSLNVKQPALLETFSALFIC